MTWLSNIFSSIRERPASAPATPVPAPVEIVVPPMENLPPPGVPVTFELAFERLIGHEGKLSEDYNDRGNWTSGRVGVGQLRGTKYGISAMTYPTLDIRNLTLSAARDIYRRDFWLRAHADEYDGAIGYQVFDSAVNHGIGNAIRFLQRAVFVADDGDVGPLTMDAVRAQTVTDVLMRFNAERLEFYTKLSTWPDFGKGWSRRVVGNLRYGAVDA